MNSLDLWATARRLKPNQAIKISSKDFRDIVFREQKSLLLGSTPTTQEVHAFIRQAEDTLGLEITQNIFTGHYTLYKPKESIS